MRRAVELSRSAAVPEGKVGMADGWPPWRAAPRPLAGVLGCLDGRLRAGGVVTTSVLDSPFHRAAIGGVVKSERSFRQLTG